MDRRMFKNLTGVPRAGCARFRTRYGLEREFEDLQVCGPDGSAVAGHLIRNIYPVE